MITHKLTDETFESEIANSTGKVLIDVGADWCNPCQVLAKTIASLDDTLPVKIYTLDVDDSPATAKRFNVKGVPTMILFVDGTKVAEKVGVISKNELIKFISA